MQIHGYSAAFMGWNIFLALIPCWTVYYLLTHKKARINKVVFGLLFLVWLFFLPNTAYLFFMVRHLVDYCQDYNNYRVCIEGGSWVPLFFFTYALVGLPTFYYALRKMADVVKCWSLPIMIIPLVAMGLMYGLYDRFNTWDIVTRPRAVLETGFSYINNPARLTDLVIFTVLLYVIYYVTDFLMNRHD